MVVDDWLRMGWVLEVASTEQLAMEVGEKQEMVVVWHQEQPQSADDSWTL